MIKIILCALNEAQNLEKLIPNIALELNKLNRDFEIIICLDGSYDNSEDLILTLKKSYPIRILNILNQKGLGVASKRLFLDVINNCDNNDIIISFDADNTHNPNQLEEIINHFEKNSLDVLIASRFCKNSVTIGFPAYRFFISKSTSIVMQTIFGIKKINNKRLKDYSSGYRAYNINKLKQLYKTFGDNFITERNFIYTCEILLNINKIGAKFDEIALNYNYGQKIGESKLKIMQNMKSLIALILRMKITKF